ncbi:hypothetical protein EUX98_g6532 [Antrodiella citrinella]|uniref:PARP catalytic domain-containing protein n=1 Tax=Antrodiella citrinella TaxID=2447956 RepID=A0A4S4MNW2_9APHY|nr:hypothetical protein EUX98_g6532 [Antrodiella citrinella]
MVHLLPLATNDPVYRESERLFRQGWQHPGKTYKLKNIFYVIQDGPEAQRHLFNNRAYLSQLCGKYGTTAATVERMLFHGSKRGCYLGEDKTQLYPCNNTDCFLCLILKCSFQLNKITNPRLMFGKGFYTSSVSSKSDIYVENRKYIKSRQRAMFLSNVSIGRSQTLYQADNARTGPDFPFDSVEAATKANGGAVNYPETVVYREDAILPSVVIMYTK